MAGLEKCIKRRSIFGRIEDAVNVFPGVKGRFEVMRRFEDCIVKGEAWGQRYRVMTVF